MAKAQSGMLKQRVALAKKQLQQTFRRRRNDRLVAIGEGLKGLVPSRRARNRFRRYMRSSEAIIPVAIGALIVGTGLGVAAVMVAPRIRDSELFSNLGTNVQSAADRLGEALRHARKQMLGQGEFAARA